MFKNILVPVDGSAFSAKALKKALTLAKMGGGKITGFHVAPAYRAEVYADYVPPTYISPREFDKRTRAVAE
ncbi:MAG: universal stress protein, partial [Betaproteobacteria bacterium]